MLATADGIRTAATRMLDTTPAGRESVGNFAEEYMRLDRIVTQAKDPSLFPAYGPNLQTAGLAVMLVVLTALNTVLTVRRPAEHHRDGDEPAGGAERT